ncbi:hypothetical protein IFM89_019110 [Coptis chinensis]|uniref:Uncharacterized protein n=1 Tax=Coptis chinensis TaxID=261450 RepID=A0A835HU94_9MAGN|nr:hypothetical protein IFM89_019110 [Coptis chinensis]
MPTIDCPSMHGTSEQDRSSVASNGHTNLGSVGALPGEDLDQLELKEGAVIPTRNLSSVDHTKTGSCSPLLLDEERRLSLSEAAQFVKDLETWRNRKINPSRKSKRQ